MPRSKKDNAASEEDARVHPDPEADAKAAEDVEEHQADAIALEAEEDERARDESIAVNDHADRLKADGEHADSLREIKFALDNALARFENTSASDNLAEARVTIDGVKESLDGIRTMVADSLHKFEDGKV